MIKLLNILVKISDIILFLCILIGFNKRIQLTRRIFDVNNLRVCSHFRILNHLSKKYEINKEELVVFQ